MTESTLSWLFPNGITDLTVAIPQPNPSPSSSSCKLSPATTTAPPTRRREVIEPGPARWRTKEFCFYYAVFVIFVPLMIKAVVDLSRESHPNYKLYQHRLRDGWIFGWKVDISDHQWYIFRTNLPLLSILAIAYLLASRIFSFFFPSPPPSSTSPSPTSTPSTAIPQPPPRTYFLLAFSLLLLTLLHGSSLPKMLLILYLNFRISRLASPRVVGKQYTKFAPVASWTFNLVMLFANELGEGYYWSSIWSGLAVLDEPWAKGILPRWHINWNITMLRLISFNMDYYWACTASSSYPVSVSNGDETKEPLLAFPPPTLSDRHRTSTSHPLSLYSFPLYLAYALYPPLYLAGPLLTYNAFLSQLLSPPKIPFRAIVGYAVRFGVCLLTMELVGHTMYVVAIKDSGRGESGAWSGDGPFQLSMIGFWNLIVVWLKLLIPWRFFRLWSLLDGIDPPENMVRCMANNYSTLGFWRAWHRSYNLWIVRYIYIPLGGSSHAILSTLLVFTFVALWHDLSLKLLTWGWVISLFVLPEMAGQKLLPYNKYGNQPWYRHVAAVGGVFNILMMMTANLIGFAIGTEGTSYMWKEMVGTWEGRKFMIVAFGGLFVAVQVMFEYREEERRKGIIRRF